MFQEKCETSETSKNSSLDDVVYLDTTMLSEGDVDKYSIIAELTSHDYHVIESPTGWLENTVIQQAHVLLKKVNPSIQGLQRTSLGAFCNFDQVDRDFIQILHTGGNVLVLLVVRMVWSTCMTVFFVMLSFMILNYKFGISLGTI